MALSVREFLSRNESDGKAWYVFQGIVDFMSVKKALISLTVKLS